jgi:hypothetical protein
VLIIRAEQMRAFEEAALRRFAQRAADFLERRFPERCQKLGRAAVLRSVHAVAANARAYDLASEVDVIDFLRLMYRLGHELDPDAAWEWARARSGTHV